jgi:hypothetical protein
VSPRPSWGRCVRRSGCDLVLSICAVQGPGTYSLQHTGMSTTSLQRIPHHSGTCSFLTTSQRSSITGELVPAESFRPKTSQTPELVRSECARCCGRCCCFSSSVCCVSFPSRSRSLSRLLAFSLVASVVFDGGESLLPCVVSQRCRCLLTGTMTTAAPRDRRSRSARRKVTSRCRRAVSAMRARPCLRVLMLRSCDTACRHVYDGVQDPAAAVQDEHAAGSGCTWQLRSW